MLVAVGELHAMCVVFLLTRSLRAQERRRAREGPTIRWSVNSGGSKAIHAGHTLDSPAPGSKQDLARRLIRSEKSARASEAMMLPCNELTLVFAEPWEWKMQAKSMLISLEIGHASKVSDKVTFSTVREGWVAVQLTNRLDHRVWTGCSPPLWRCCLVLLTDLLITMADLLITAAAHQDNRTYQIDI